MFGYFDLIVFILVLAIYIYNRPKVKKYLRKNRKAKIYPIEIAVNGVGKRFICLKCDSFVSFIISVPRGVYGSMLMWNKKQQLYHKLCRECLSDYGRFEAKTINNSLPIPNGDPVFKLLVLDQFLEDKLISFAKVLELYNNYDPDLKKALVLLHTKEFDGDVYSMREAAKISLNKNE
jgi:hypothetical protein